MPEPKRSKSNRELELFPASSLFDLQVTFNQDRGFADFRWEHPAGKKSSAGGRIRCGGTNELVWELETDSARETKVTRIGRDSIRKALSEWLDRFPASLRTVRAVWVRPAPNGSTTTEEEEAFEEGFPIYSYLEDNVVAMAEALSKDRTVGQFYEEGSAFELADPERYYRRLMRKDQKRADEQARRLERMAQLAAERRKREAARAKTPAASKAKAAPAPTPSAGPREPLPEVPVLIEKPSLEFQDTPFPLENFQKFFLLERASVWWVSNQSDDLLCLEDCRIQRLEYQVRTALRVLGPLRGRALLSDEVGLGKTIEAGLVVKELLTRGMVKRFLILTTPSLADQWQEELEEKFSLRTMSHLTSRAIANCAGCLSVCRLATNPIFSRQNRSGSLRTSGSFVVFGKRRARGRGDW